MTRGRKVQLVIVLGVVVIVGWFSLGAIHTWKRLPEANAAWDTGTLLIEYMEHHGDRWPASWEELLTVLDSPAGKQIPLHGSQAGDVEYARSVREKIVVDWTFDPANAELKNPVSPLEGGPFSVVWNGAEPNDMIRDYLAERASTLPTRSTAGLPIR